MNRAEIHADADLMLIKICKKIIAFPNLIVTIKRLRRSFDVICMLKDLKQICYRYCGRSLRQSELYAVLKKRQGKTIVKASVIVHLSCDTRVRIVFARGRVGSPCCQPI